jgi:hypothetical protein
MVTAIVDIQERTNRLLNIIKAEENLKTKSEAIDALATRYEALAASAELRSEFVQHMRKSAREQAMYVGSVSAFGRRYLSSRNPSKSRQKAAPSGKKKAALSRRD